MSGIRDTGSRERDWEKRRGPGAVVEDDATARVLLVSHHHRWSAGSVRPVARGLDRRDLGWGVRSAMGQDLHLPVRSGQVRRNGSGLALLS